MVATTVFTHAVASFDPTETSVLLWTRLAQPDSASWAVARDPELHQVVAEGEVHGDGGRDNTAVVEVAGLDPATTYFYRFCVGDEGSPVGRTRTLPSAPTGRLRLGLASCARYSVDALGAYRALAEREVDLVVHLGDYIYEDDGHKGPRRHEPPRPAIRLDDYRQRIAQVRSDPDCQALHLRHPMVAIIDDHDVADNCWATGAKKHDEAEDGPWIDRAVAAATARQEWLPQRLADPHDPRRTWRGVPVGDLAELLLLDSRLSGRDQQAGDDGVRRLDDPERSLLGDDQRRWLYERLADTGRTWAVVASGVVVNEINLPLPALGFINVFLPNGYAALDGRMMHDDQWDGYPAERDRLVERLQDRGRAGGRSVLLSADIHSSWAFEGPLDPDGGPVAVEFTVPAVSSKPLGRSHVPGLWRILDGLVRRLDHVPWAEVTRRGYGILDLTPERAVMEWWVVEATASDPASEAWLGAVWVTDRDGWPPSLHPGSPTTDPHRSIQRDPLPGRPENLRSMQRSHRLRLIASRGTAIGAIAGVATLVTGAVRRRHRPVRSTIPPG